MKAFYDKRNQILLYGPAMIGIEINGTMYTNEMEAFDHSC